MVACSSLSWIGLLAQKPRDGFDGTNVAVARDAMELEWIAEKAFQILLSSFREPDLVRDTRSSYQILATVQSLHSPINPGHTRPPNQARTTSEGPTV